MDWDMPMTMAEKGYSYEPLTAESYIRSLQTPGAVYRALQMGSIAKPRIEDVFKLYPQHFSRLLSFADKMGIEHSDLLNWLTDYVVWAESEDFIER